MTFKLPKVLKSIAQFQFFHFMLPSAKGNINCIFCALAFGDILPLYVFSNKFIIYHDCWGLYVSGTYTGDGEGPGMDSSCIVNGTRTPRKFLLFLCLLLVYIVSFCWIWSRKLDWTNVSSFFFIKWFFCSYWLLWFSFVVAVDNVFFISN